MCIQSELLRWHFGITVRVQHFTYVLSRRRLKRLEHLMERRPELLSSVMLRQNPHNVHEWHKRVHLFPDKPTRQILVYTEAVKTVDADKARCRPNWPPRSCPRRCRGALAWLRNGTACMLSPYIQYRVLRALAMVSTHPA